MCLKTEHYVKMHNTQRGWGSHQEARILVENATYALCIICSWVVVLLDWQ